jgi:CheY-like chemotaxis protein
MTASTRILVIDDDPEIRDLIHAILGQAGHDVAEADGVVAALDSLRERPADVVVTDIIMPGRDGLEAIREIRDVQPQLKIIAISGGGRRFGVEVLRLAKNLGADLALAKPFSSDALLSAVQTVVCQT